MNFPFYIARRYLFSKKRTNLINIIAGISVAGMTIGTMGLVIGLSGFNGFDMLVKSLFSSFDPDLKITIVEGKSFNCHTSEFEQIRKMEQIAYFSEIVEDNALLKYGNRQVLATIKGVPDNFSAVTGIDTLLVEGKFLLKDGSSNYAIFGQGVAYYLSAGMHPEIPITVYAPQKGRKTNFSIEENFNQGFIYPSAVFSVQQELDSKYVLVPVDFARQLFGMEDKVSSIELKIKPGIDPESVGEKIKTLLGQDYQVKNRYQQHDYLYKTMQGEKYAVYLILILILIIASFNLIGSLSMLILDKKEDIAILKSMGASPQTIRSIFLMEGWMISMAGATLGTILGLMVCQIQIIFKLVKLQGGGSFIIDSYPINIVPFDILLIYGSVLLIGFFAAWFPVRHISGKYLDEQFH